MLRAGGTSWPSALAALSLMQVHHQRPPLPHQGGRQPPSSKHSPCNALPPLLPPSQMLDNIFVPLFDVTKDPSSHPQLHVYLSQVCVSLGWAPTVLLGAAVICVPACLQQHPYRCLMGVEGWGGGGPGPGLLRTPPASISHACLPQHAGCSPTPIPASGMLSN